MAESEHRFGGRARRRAELERRSAEMDELEPYLQLAREIQLEVARLASDESTVDADSLVSALEAIPREERRRVTLAVFERLPVEVQWAAVERAFGADEIREHLADEHAARVAEIARRDDRQRLADAARVAGRLDPAQVAVGDDVTLGLFREEDVRAALERGHRADTCARQIVLRRDGDGLRVLEDVFNPRGGLFVTREYDEDTWRAERLDSHVVVQVGSERDTGAGRSFEPVLYPGGRVDVATGEGTRRGRLHLGFVLLGPIDVFAAERVARQPVTPGRYVEGRIQIVRVP